MIVVHSSFAILMALIGAVGVLHDVWPDTVLIASAHLHLLFGVLLACWVISRFYWQIRLSPVLLISDLRNVSRHSSRMVYLLLYLLFGLKQIVALLCDRPIFAFTDDLQGYLVAGLAALVLIRVFALLGLDFRRYRRDCTLAASVLVAVALSTVLASNSALADNFLDHRVSKDTGGIYQAQDAVPIALALLAGGCALWEGTENRVGKTCWESAESGAASLILSEGLQLITRRESPDTTSDPNHWFKGSKGSFPSNHVSLTTGVVTPFILQYAHDDPWIAALAILPVYEMVARVKAREHWQSDVIAGAALGFAIGAYEHHRNSPLVFYALPGGAFVGFQKSF